MDFFQELNELIKDDEVVTMHVLSLFILLALDFSKKNLILYHFITYSDHNSHKFKLVIFYFSIYLKKITTFPNYLFFYKIQKENQDEQVIIFYF